MTEEEKINLINQYVFDEKLQDARLQEFREFYDYFKLHVVLIKDVLSTDSYTYTNKCDIVKVVLKEFEDVFFENKKFEFVKTLYFYKEVLNNIYDKKAEFLVMYMNPKDPILTMQNLGDLIEIYNDICLEQLKKLCK